MGRESGREWEKEKYSGWGNSLCGDTKAGKKHLIGDRKAPVAKAKGVKLSSEKEAYHTHHDKHFTIVPRAVGSHCRL